jgi:hypothetical protein
VEKPVQGTRGAPDGATKCDVRPFKRLPARPLGDFAAAPREISTYGVCRTMCLLRRVTALLSASLLLQFILVGSGVPCGSLAMKLSVATDAPHEGEVRASGVTDHQRRAHDTDTRPDPRTGTVSGLSTIAVAPNVDAYPGMSGHGCGLSSAPSPGDCRTMSSCTSTIATFVHDGARAIAAAEAADLRLESGAPASWMGRPDIPPPRA